MKTLSPNPILYEINTFVWLGELSHKYRREVILGSVPDEEWATLAEMGVELVWLMGVWERSPMAIDLVRHNPIALVEFKQMLPDFLLEDFTGSPYSVRRYQVDPQIGGDQGLAEERIKLSNVGIRLILDYVPNHLAPDHPWTIDHPEYFIQGNPSDLAGDPESYIQIGTHILARGKDPNFPAWMDVVQLNAFDLGMRQATLEVILGIASKCDGMRVDMAMLLINRIFASTWGVATGEAPETEYWPSILHQVKTSYPGTLFIAETYWDTEEEQISFGFDFCYDKHFYDYLRAGDPRKTSSHLNRVKSYQNKLVRFIENHDEQRARTAFPEDRWKVAPLVAATLPGMRMFHQGQLEGRREKVSVLLRRWPAETPDENVSKFYNDLMNVINSTPIKEGKWERRPMVNENGNRLSRSLVWAWQNKNECRTIVINLSQKQVTGKILLDLPSSQLADAIQDIWTGETFESTYDTGRGFECRIQIPPKSGRILKITWNSSLSELTGA